jgi:hypothetical protein
VALEEGRLILTLSDYSFVIFKIVIPAGIGDSLECVANPDSMDGFELTISGTGYPLPCGKHELS